MNEKEKLNWGSVDTTMYDLTHDIRFIDSKYNTLFFLENGRDIYITCPNGDRIKAMCFYIDPYHVKVDHMVFHICEFAEWMERNNNTYCPVVTPLPPKCFAIPSSDSHQIIEITRYKKGIRLVTRYDDKDKNEVLSIVNKWNRHRGVTKAQSSAMSFANALDDWNCPAACPDNYDIDGKPTTCAI